MEPTHGELIERYTTMELAELQVEARQRDLLTDTAKEMLLREFQRRGVEPDSVDMEPKDFSLAPEVWVTVERFRDLSAGIVARSALEAAEIHCFLRDENTVRLDWQVSNFIGGMRLQVLEADAEAAREVLAGLALDEEPVSDTESSSSDERCPKCGSTAIHRKRTRRGLALAFLWLFSVPIPQGEAEWRCNHCGWRWIDKPGQHQSRS